MEKKTDLEDYRVQYWLPKSGESGGMEAMEKGLVRVQLEENTNSDFHSSTAD